MNSGGGESSGVVNKELPRTMVLARIAMNSGSGESSGVTGDTFVNIVEQDSVEQVGATPL